MKKAIIFEEILPKHRHLVFFYLKQGYEVFYLRLIRQSEKEKWVRQLLSSCKLQKVPFNPRVYFFDGIFDTRAFDILDDYYPHIFRINDFFFKLDDLYKSGKFDLPLKNLLMKKLTRFCYLNQNLFYICESFKDYKKLLFIPVRTLPIFQISENDVTDYRMFYQLAERHRCQFLNTQKVNFPIWLVVLTGFQLFLQKVIFLLKLLCLPLYLFSKTFSCRKQKGVFKVAHMILSNRQFENKTKPVDFFIDGELLKKNDVLFIPYNHFSQDQIKYFNELHLHYIENTNTSFNPRYVMRSCKYIFMLFGAALKGDLDVLNCSLNFIYYYVKWSSLTDAIQVQNLLSQNIDTVPPALARDFIFKQKKTQIWKYMDSAGLVNYFVPYSEYLTAKEISFAYMYCDYLVSWSKDNSDAFRTTKSLVGEYLESGHLWAEISAKIEGHEIESALGRELLNRRKDYKIVGIFDTTLYEYYPCEFKTGIQFIEDLKRLLDDFPQIYIIYKEKKARKIVEKESPELLKMLTELESHPRVLMVFNKVSPSEVIAFSDLIISFAYTSTTLEALTLKKRAFWHDPANRFTGTYYDQVPGLATHNYQELKARVGELLQLSDEKYNQYLERYMKDFCCTYFDGRGIKRLRDFLITKKCVQNISNQSVSVSIEN